MVIRPREMHETEEYSDTHGDFYVETDTSLIYEVKFFDDFVLVRPASPQFYLALRKMSISEFSRDFHEFCGDHQEVRDCLEGAEPEIYATVD